VPIFYEDINYCVYQYHNELIAMIREFDKPVIGWIKNAFQA